jgi:hypothetical protein
MMAAGSRAWAQVQKGPEFKLGFFCLFFMHHQATISAESSLTMAATTRAWAWVVFGLEPKLEFFCCFSNALLLNYS